jgi:hypothetical protein
VCVFRAPLQQLFQKIHFKAFIFLVESYPLPGGPDTIQDTSFVRVDPNKINIFRTGLPSRIDLYFEKFSVVAFFRI